MPDKLTIAKVRKENNSEITCDRVTVLALCIFSDGRLSMYQVLFNFLLYFQIYAPDKFFSTKIKKGSNSINTGDRVMFLILYNSPYSISSFIKLPSILLETCSWKSVTDGRTDKAATIWSPIGEHKNRI